MLRKVRKKPSKGQEFTKLTVRLCVIVWELSGGLPKKRKE